MILENASLGELLVLAHFLQQEVVRTNVRNGAVIRHSNVLNEHHFRTKVIGSFERTAGFPDKRNINLPKCHVHTLGCMKCYLLC